MYYPILRAKAGELAALTALSTDLKAQINPILQVVPDPKTSKKRASNPDIHWDNLANKINKLTGINNVYLDNTYINNDLEGFEKLIERINADISITPVLQPNSSEEYVEYVLLNFPSNILLRIKNEFSTTRLVNDSIAHFRELFQIGEDSIKLVFDYGYADLDNMNTILASFEQLSENVVNFDLFNSVIVASGCFPTDVSDFQPDQITHFSRSEWILFQRLRHLNDAILYSDYANVNPNFNPLAQAFLGSCTIKYTTDNDYYILRGVRPDTHPDGNGQYHSKCVELVNMEIYSGRNYSIGDRYIYDCAAREVTPGNALTWVRTTQNHHFTKVLEQLNEL